MHSTMRSKRCFAIGIPSIEGVRPLLSVDHGVDWLCDKAFLIVDRHEERPVRMLEFRRSSESRYPTARIVDLETGEVEIRRVEDWKGVRAPSVN